MVSLARLLLVALFLFSASARTWAQATSTGTVNGQVTDAQGAAVAGAEVKLIDSQTNSTRTTATNDVGRYTFVNVEPAVYDISVSKEGFSLARVSAQKVEVGLALTVNVALQIGATTTTVEVQAAAGAELQVMNSTVGSTISGASMVLLPNLGRDASTLSVLQVGVAPTGNVAGSASDQNVFQLDGGNNSDDMSGTASTYTPSNGYAGPAASGGTPSGVIPTPVESIEEFKVGTSNQTADFNGAAGSQVSMVTKRGTNQFHGALYEYYFATNVGAANLWRNNHTPNAQLGLPYTPLPSSHRNRFGGALGGPLTPKFWGGKTFFFVNYEGYRFPNSTTIEKNVPTVLMRAGVIQVQNASGNYVPYNLNPFPVTVNGTSYQPAQCSNGGACDPRKLGLNPIVQQIWNKYMPLANDPTGGDTVNTQGYLTPIALPQKSTFGVMRLDHDFGDKWHFMSSYRYYGYSQLTSQQADIGGALPGDALGHAAAAAPRPEKPSYLVAGLTTTITPNLTNDFRFSYLRNQWQWSTVGAPPQLPGLGGALEIGGETSNALVPYNVDSQSTRARQWDGHDAVYRDDISLLHGNHLFQFGGSYQRNFDFFTRNDNGIGIDAALVYQSSNGSLSFPAAYQPAGLPPSQVTNWNTLFAEVTGIVSQTQALYTRTLPALTLNPVGVPIYIHALLPKYDAYFSDSWHLNPHFTLTYGLSYILDLPPYSPDGKQVVFLGDSGTPLSYDTYIDSKQTAALKGQVYNPTVGFATIQNVPTHPKYLYTPFYGGFSPRIAAAWNPSFDKGVLGSIFGGNKTVIRGGYSRIYGRTQGIRMAGVPANGVGIGQVMQCVSPTIGGTCGGQQGADPTNAFRIGTDGLSAPVLALPSALPQPYFPGVNGNPTAGDGALLDSNFHQDRSDELNFTVQRQLSPKMVVEAGYIGRKIAHEYQLINIDAVPYMTTLDGQSFAQAYANIYSQYCGLGSTCAGNAAAVTVQPFFEAALGGGSSAYCAKYSSCTAAVIANQATNLKTTLVYNLWTALGAAPSWTLGRTLLGSPAIAGGNVAQQLTALELSTSNGFGNYNALFLTFNAKDWHGMTARSNFTWGRALGTGTVNQSGSSMTVVDPWNLHAAYGPQPYDVRFVYNLTILYQPPYFKEQKGVVGRVLGGWSIAPLFTAQSGAPLEVNVGTGSNQDAQAFGEVYGNSNSAYENAVLIAPFSGGNSAHNNVTVSSGAGLNGNASRGGSGMNLFANPNAIYAEFRRPILGLDTTDGGAGVIRGFPTWNLDATVSKDIRATEKIGATFMFQFSNILNHFQPANPSMNIDSPATWGVVTNQATSANGLQSRQMEFGLRIRF